MHRNIDSLALWKTVPAYCWCFTNILNLWVVRIAVRVAGNITDDAGLVDQGSQRTVGVDRDMERLMDHEVIPRSLADDLEVVHKGGFIAYLAIEVPLRYARRIVSGSSG